MRIDRLLTAAVVLLVAAAGVEVHGQARPRPRPLQRTTDREVPSLFGPRSLGYPTYPKPRNFGGGGQFGPRPNLGRGFSSSSGTNIWQDFSYSPSEAAQSYIQFHRTGQRAMEPAAQPSAPRQQSPAGRRQAGLQEVPPGGPAGPAEPPPGQAQPPRRPVEPMRRPTEPTPGQAAQAEAASGQMPPEGASAVGQGEAAAATPGQELSAGAPIVARNPRFQWRSDLLSGQRHESVLVERLRRALGDRLRSPVEVSIDDQTATLRGVVATEHDRLLAGHVARFEPGVLRVENELVAASASERPAEARPAAESAE